MSTLEERREARRRRRQQDEEAAGFSTINGEDELELRRRERREQRLRSGVTETPAEEDTTSRRSRRRRGTEDEIDTGNTEEVTTRSHRRRGQEEVTESAPEPVSATVPEPQVDREEEERRRREEEEEAERQRQAAEAARRRAQEEEDRRRQQEEEKRRQEAERRRREEGKTGKSDPDMASTEEKRKHDEHERRIDEQLQRLKALEKDNDLLVKEDWNRSIHHSTDEHGRSPPSRKLVTDYVLRLAEDGKCGKLKSFFEEKNEGQLNGDDHDMNLNISRKKETKKDLAAYQAKVFTPGPSRLKDIQKKFEVKNSTENASSQLGRFSCSEIHLNDKLGLHKDKKNILERWNSAIETKTPLNQSARLSKSMSMSYEFDLNKKGDSIERLSLKFNNNKTDSYVHIASSAHHANKEMSLLKRQWSHNVVEQSQKEKSTNRHSVPKLMERWLQITQLSAESASPTHLEPIKIIGSKLSNENSIEEEERKERERLEEEEREREEAARIMEEQQQKKKKGKRKGLGGLSPEKKKMLKDDENSSSEDEDDPYNIFMNDRTKLWNAEKTRILEKRIMHVPNLNSMNKGDLVKLCKELHKKLSQLEEEVYDWEVKIRKQDAEIIQLTLKVNDSKGKFAKPVLKKVNKTESKLNKIAKKDKADFRDNLKSSGQSKFALDEEGEEKAE